MRKICVLELLSAKKVQSFQAIREQESCILSQNIFLMINTIISRVAIGSTSKDQGAFLVLIQEAINLASGFDLADLFPSIKIVHQISGMRNKLMKIHEKMDKILDNIISDHQEDPHGGGGGGGGGGLMINRENGDLLDVLLRLKYDGALKFPITYDNIKQSYCAGTDTSSVTIEWAMSELIKNPRVMKKAQSELCEALKGKTKVHESDVQELGYLKLVIKETLRLHPPLPLLLPRECREKCEIGGYEIPIKSKVIINGWKMGRDPDYWVDSESFVPERFSTDDHESNKVETDFGYLPFGAGRRMCPGMSLGLANVELPLAMLLYHFNWELPNKVTFESFDMSESFGVTLKRKNDLILVPIPYKY